MPTVIVCESLIKPQIIPIASSQGDGHFYEVVAQTVFNDSVCECRGYQFRGTCKHVQMVEEMRCNYHRMPEDAELIEGERCPECRNPLVLFELEPELD